MKPFVFALCIGVLVVFASCDDDGVVPKGDGAAEFSFVVGVTDVNGNPVSGLRVSAWNDLSIFPIPVLSAGHTSREALPVTRIRFAVLSVADINVSVYEFDNTLIETLVDTQMPAGEAEVPWVVFERNDGIHKIVLVARDTVSGSVIFRDSVFALLWQPDPDVNILGYTDDDGSFQTTNELLFPNLLTLPTPLIYVDELCAELGEFSVLDSLTIVLADTASSQEQWFRGTVTEESDTLRLVWDPPAVPVPPSPSWQPEANVNRNELLWGEVRRLTVVTQEWKLYQVCPNPFN